MDKLERCRAYVASIPGAISGSGGDAATFRVALAITRGFALEPSDARRVMEEYNTRCQPPWSVRDLEHKLHSASRSGSVELGYLLKEEVEASGVSGFESKSAPRVARPEYEAKELERFADSNIDELFFANRSAVDPSSLGPRGFLNALYNKESEKIVCFENQMTQGEALWPDEKPPLFGEKGIWFLTAPVDGQYRINPRGERDKKGRLPRSRRIAECALRFPYMVFESDCAEQRAWLSLLAALPLPIEAIYTSAGRSIHALVRVNARTAAEFNQIKQRMSLSLGFLALCGLDWRAVTPMRLSRLPGCKRGGKLQRLLYIQPNASARPIKEMLPLRDVEEQWLSAASYGISDTDGGKGLFYALRFYAPYSDKISQVLKDLEREVS